MTDIKTKQELVLVDNFILRSTGYILISIVIEIFVFKKDKFKSL